MPRRYISADLKAAVCSLYLAGELSLPAIQRYAFTANTLDRALDQLLDQGFISAQCGGPGRPRRLTKLDFSIIEAEVRRNPSVYLDELQDLLAQHGQSVALSTISRRLCNVNYTTRKLAWFAMERSQPKVRNFLWRVSMFTAEQLVFTDESSFDSRTPGRTGGRAQRGNRRAEFGNRRVRGQRFSLVSGLGLQEEDGDSAMMAPLVVEGSITSAIYCEWIAGLMQLCEPFPGKHSVIVCDNATVHKQAETIIRDFGCIPVFLSPYSPYLNPIEQAFGQVKAHMRRSSHVECGYPPAVTAYSIYQACDAVKSSHAKGYFTQDGYRSRYE